MANKKNKKKAQRAITAYSAAYIQFAVCPRLHRRPHSLYRRPRSRRQAAAIPMQAAHLPPRSPGRTQRILTQAMRPAHRRRPAQAHRFTPGKRPRPRPHRLSRRRHPAARAATLTAMWPPAASPSAPAHQCPPSG